jgi:hypothetical protein
LKLKLLASTLIFIGAFAHAESATTPSGTVDQTSTNNAQAIETAPQSAEVAREKSLDDEFSKCVPNDAKYKNRCAMLEASKASISHSQSIVHYAQELQMGNIYLKYLTDRESSGLGYCRLKGAVEAAKAKYNPSKDVGKILELIAGCMADQYQQVGKQESQLNQIIDSENVSSTKK